MARTVEATGEVAISVAVNVVAGDVARCPSTSTWIVYDGWRRRHGRLAAGQHGYRVKVLWTESGRVRSGRVKFGRRRDVAETSETQVVIVRRGQLSERGVANWLPRARPSIGHPPNRRCTSSLCIFEIGDCGFQPVQTPNLDLQCGK